MEIKNRLFPYPVLCADTDDYISGGFTVETEIVKQDINNLVLKLVKENLTLEQIHSYLHDNFKRQNL